MTCPSETFSPQNITEEVDGIASIFSTPAWEEEISKARLEFDKLRGKIYDDEELYKKHIASFLEWFILERPLPDGMTPVEHHYQKVAHQCAHQPNEDLFIKKDRLASLAISHRSLFLVLKSKASRLLLKDIIGGGHWKIEGLNGSSNGLLPQEVFEGRLFPWQGTVRLGPVTWFHPREAIEWILKLVIHSQQSGRLGPELVGEFAKMRLKYSRFRNIPMHRIYSFDFKGERRG